ncbi:hypothetical protein ACEQ8H_003585 [Pleosporales sp. CAS-2024a]
MDAAASASSQSVDATAFPADARPHVPLADRMKAYEAVYDARLPEGSPIIMRLDGHNFSRFTSHFARPFDERIHVAMTSTCASLLSLFPAATVAYTQSDEITLVFPSGVGAFNSRIQKMSSLAASYCSVHFVQHLFAAVAQHPSPAVQGGEAHMWTAHFDARVFAVPNAQEALNNMLWRCRNDAVRNAVSSFARTMFTAKEMQGKNTGQLLEKMKDEKGVIFADAVPKWAMEGCLVKREQFDHEGLNKLTGEMEMTKRTRTRVEERGVREFSEDNLRIVVAKYCRAIEWSTDLFLWRKAQTDATFIANHLPIDLRSPHGRFFRHLGVYLAERGTTLGRLEQLVGCQSVFTALERQITLRYWSMVGFLSILVWLLSPLGGQSALRLLDMENRNVSSTATVRYLNPLTVTQSVLDGASDLNSGWATFTSIFLAALLSSSKYQDASMDLWGNVKFPLYKDIMNTTLNEWKLVSQGDQGGNVTYGSLIGVPTIGMPSDGYSNFSIKARQFDITCSSNEMRFGVKNDSIWANVTGTWGLESDPSSAAIDYPRPIISMSLAGDYDTGSNYSVAACNVDLNYLEAKVVCNGTSCGVDAVRKLDLLTDGYTKDDDEFTRGNIMTNLMSVLPRVDNIVVGSPSARGSSNAEKWMADPTNFIGATYDNVQLFKLDPDVYARRLTILWNTIYQSTFATIALGGALPKNLTQTGLLVNPNGFSPNITFNGTQAHVVQQTLPVYKTNWKWFVALLFSSLVLLAAAYAGLILKYMTLAPDIIGYASSLTILNPYIPTPTGGTTLHGLERAAILHDLPVRIGDVCSNEPVGAIAFARADEGRVARLTRRRWYI